MVAFFSEMRYILIELCVFFADLKTMTERLKANYYVNARLFNADMLRIFKNCRFYNHPETEYYKCANNLEKYYINKMRELGLLESK